MSDATELEPEIKVLRAKARDAQTDDFITDYDYINDDGDKIRKRIVAGPADTTKEIEFNLTEIYTAGPSTTGDVSLLVLEAEMLAEGYELGNPHIPVDMQTMETAEKRIESNDHTPAWEVFE